MKTTSANEKRKAQALALFERDRRRLLDTLFAMTDKAATCPHYRAMFGQTWHFANVPGDEEKIFTVTVEQAGEVMRGTLAKAVEMARAALTPDD